MGDLVTCAECSVRYDVAVHAFCPRCGSTAKGRAMPAVLDVARRHDPGRRRVQASGAVLAVVGGLLALLFVPILLLAGTFVSGTLDQITSQGQDLGVPGGALVVVATQDGVPVAGLAVNVTTPAGAAVANGTTDADGRFETPLGTHAFVTVHLDAGDGAPETSAPAGPNGNESAQDQGNASNGTFTRKAVALEGTTATVRIDVAEDAPESDAWIGAKPLLQVMRILLGVFLAIALLLCAAGVCALRLKAWGFAVTGAALGVIPVLLLAVASLSVGFLLILIVLGVPLLFIARGRRYFEPA